MQLIVGLGNPGEKYAKARHNLGFMVVDAFLRKLTPIKKTVWKKDQKNKSLIAKVDDLLLVKPQTYMNQSGLAVASLVKSLNLSLFNLWIIHDDLDLPLGKIKIREGGAAAGHHGVESIIEKLETDKFVRFRLGIGSYTPGSSRKGAEKYVLSPFVPKESSKVRQMVKKTVKAINLALESGLEKAMSRVNQ